jgi:hypothetical protein
MALAMLLMTLALYFSSCKEPCFGPTAHIDWPRPVATWSILAHSGRCGDAGVGAGPADLSGPGSAPV